MKFDNSNVSVLRDMYLQQLAGNPNFSPRTKVTYKSILNQFVYQLAIDDSEVDVDTEIVSMDSYHVSLFLKKMGDRKYSESAISTTDSCLKHFYNWLEQESDWVAQFGEFKNPYSSGRSKAPHPSHEYPRHLTADEVIEFVLMFGSEAVRVALVFLFDSGVRISELVALRLKNFKDAKVHPNGFVTLSIPGAKGRGGQIRTRTVSVSRTTFERVLEFIAAFTTTETSESAPVFRSATGQPLKENTFQRYLIRHQEEVKFSHLDGRVTAHDLRHSTAFTLLSFSVFPNFLDELVSVMQQLGHRRFESVTKYMRFNVVDINAEREIFSERGIKSRLQLLHYVNEKTT